MFQLQKPPTKLAIKRKVQKPTIPKINVQEIIFVLVCSLWCCNTFDTHLFSAMYFCAKKAFEVLQNQRLFFYLLRSYRWSLNLVYCKWRDAERPEKEKKT